MTIEFYVHQLYKDWKMDDFACNKRYKDIKNK